MAVVSESLQRGFRVALRFFAPHNYFVYNKNFHPHDPYNI